LADVLVTGGAGFIGSNLAARLLSRGESVRVFDDLSRPGSEVNLAWLRRQFGSDSFRFVRASLADKEALRSAVAGAEVIYHLAGQVAVTRSVADPAADYEANANGTFYLLESVRHLAGDAIFLYASTNKVYGSLADVCVREGPLRYELAGLPAGVPETFPLDFHSPYGCSKGAGDQYARDYARIYGIRTVVFRQSCIYGPRQFGQADQGWLAWFVLCGLRQKPVVICGDGKQVRDVLYIDDLLDAYDAAVRNVDTAAGEIFNVGGGPENSLAVWSELEPILREVIGATPPVVYQGWRPGDQKIYVSDISKIRTRLGWRPRTGVRDGIRHLAGWIRGHLDLFPEG
jgi:CDP-paratose 2-epimerase